MFSLSIFTIPRCSASIPVIHCLQSSRRLHCIDRQQQQQQYTGVADDILFSCIAVVIVTDAAAAADLLCFATFDVN